MLLPDFLLDKDPWILRETAREALVLASMTFASGDYRLTARLVDRAAVVIAETADHVRLD